MIPTLTNDNTNNADENSSNDGNISLIAFKTVSDTNKPHNAINDNIGNKTQRILP